jgi:hypothetical protein
MITMLNLIIKFDDLSWFIPIQEESAKGEILENERQILQGQVGEKIILCYRIIQKEKYSYYNMCIKMRVILQRRVRLIIIWRGLLNDAYFIPYWLSSRITEVMQQIEKIISSIIATTQHIINGSLLQQSLYSCWLC